jgi:hypothetical protein
VRGQGRYNTASDIVKLPKAELQVEDWQTAMRAAVVAEPDGPTMFARTQKNRRASRPPGSWGGFLTREIASIGKSESRL